MKSTMIVEDDKNIAKDLEDLLVNSGYRTAVLKDFANAEKEILKENTDLVLMDIGIPFINGEMLLKNLRKSSDIPVIILASRNNETDEVLSMSFGADDFITKPYNPTILLMV